jgi:3-hexulose-6-phosphate synthase
MIYTQVSLDVASVEEALAIATIAERAGIDWLEAGTPLLLSEGMHSVRALRERFPHMPIIADMKMMDGGYGEAELAAKAGATHVVVMARAHAETVRCAVQAGKDYGLVVMGDNVVWEDRVAGAQWLYELGCDYIVHHVGYDERRGIAARGERPPSPLDELEAIAKSVPIPVQAVGGLSIEEAIQTPKLGAASVVLGAPLVTPRALREDLAGLEAALRQICETIKRENQ